MELTDEDRATIDKLLEDVSDGFTTDYIAHYLAGMRAGMERAAKICDDEALHAELWAKASVPPFDSADIVIGIKAIDCCAAAIREAAKD